ncbi:MAG: hypothetical protein SW833_20340 [Cyanobacteriota bacterium]|nr:hypothetical protein [Cyanobacteriota bacterium]
MFNRSLIPLLSTLAAIATLSACTENSSPPPNEIPPSPEPTATPTPTPTPTQTSSPTPSPSPAQGKNRVKVFFPKKPQSNSDFSYVEPVWRATDSAGVARFAIAQLIDGPDSEEKQLGLTPVLQLAGESNCDRDFQITIRDRIAQLKFCRTVVSGGVGDDARATSAIEATLAQFPTVASIVILNKNGDCFGDGSGENECLKQGTSSQKLTEESQLALKQLGPVRIGMTPEEATRAAGHNFVQQYSFDQGGECAYYKAEGGPDNIAFMVTEGRIARIDIDSKNITTLSGAKIGDTEARIKTLYEGQIETQPHPYINPGGKYLIFVPQDPQERNYRVIFETDENGVVTRFRTGKLPEVEYIEGCL